jgi:uncharacterized membrane protein YeaQ/YmgE (transglycosylase-associated protein family)
MGILAWVVLGLVAGWIASKVMGTDDQQGVIANIAVGVLGAVIGGFLWGLFGADGAVDLTLSGLLIATTGAIVLLALYRAIAK